MSTLKIPLAAWGKTIANIDMNKLMEWLDENPYPTTMSDDDIIEQWCDDLPKSLHQDFCLEFDLALQQQVTDTYYSRIKSAIVANTEHVIYELSPLQWHPREYTDGMETLPSNFPPVGFSIESTDEGEIIVFTEESLAPLSLAIMACLQGQHGERYWGIREFHETYCISSVADLDGMIRWLSKYWGIWGDRPIEVDSGNLFNPHVEVAYIKNELLAIA